MRAVSHQLMLHARALARDVAARAVLVLADAVDSDEELRNVTHQASFPTILVSRSTSLPQTRAWPHCHWVSVPNIPLTRTGQVKIALLICLAKGILENGDRVVCLTGIDGSGVIDTCMVLNLGTEAELFSASDAVRLDGVVNPEVFARVLTLATQLAVEGREGRPVGTIFVLGDSDRVLDQSRSLVLNHFYHYPESCRNILDGKLEETIKEFSAIDGAFVVRDDGVVLAAGVQLVPSSQATPLASGLGTRHAAAAAITTSTDAVSFVISESTGTVSVFKSGEMVADIHKPQVGGRLAA